MVEVQLARKERRRNRNRQALVDAGYRLIAEKGIDAATMAEVAELADVAAGTVYNYFDSKDELVVSVMEQVMERLAQRVLVATSDFTDPAQFYAFGLRCLMSAAIADQRWRWLVRRAGVLADVMYRIIGPYALKDIRTAASAGRFSVDDPELVWRQATFAIVGFSAAVCDNYISPTKLDEAVVNLLCMVGVSRKEAWELARRPRPDLPPE